MKDYKYSFNYAINWHDIEDGVVDRPEFVEPDQVAVTVDPKESFLRIVYAQDPITKLPTGDLQYLVSDKANPEIKQWILSNIMLDVSAAVVPPAPRGLSDDDIAELARNPKETPMQYAERLNNYKQTNKALYDRMVHLSLESMGTRKDVSVESEETTVSPE